MAKPRKPRLKVFQAQLGFFESVVTAPSQAAALRAWDTHQDLFASKDAKISTDEAAIAAALRRPGTPLQRAVGTRDPFRPGSATAPTAPRSSKRSAKTPKADRSQLDRAKAALQQLEQRRRQEEAELQQAQADLQARRSAARKAYAAARKAAAAAVAKARAAYRAAGGRD
jgi:hypothetical protein